MLKRRLFSNLHTLFHIGRVAHRTSLLEYGFHFLQQESVALQSQIDSLQSQIDSLEEKFMDLHNRSLELGHALDPSQETYRERIIRNLLPERDLALRLRRFGRANDGGYYLAGPLLKDDVLISAGLADDTSFEDSVCPEIGHTIALDHTIPLLKNQTENFTHIQKALRSSIGSDSLTLHSLLETYRAPDYLLKIDIEGEEWDILDNLDISILMKFRQIVVEYHGLTKFLSQNELIQRIRVLEKMLSTHFIACSHPNNFGNYHFFGRIPVPDVIEITYLRRSGVFDKDHSSKNTHSADFDENSLIERPITNDWRKRTEWLI